MTRKFNLVHAIFFYFVLGLTYVYAQSGPSQTECNADALLACNRILALDLKGGNRVNMYVEIPTAEYVEHVCSKHDEYSQCLEPHVTPCTRDGQTMLMFLAKNDTISYMCGEEKKVIDQFKQCWVTANLSRMIDDCQDNMTARMLDLNKQYESLGVYKSRSLYCSILEDYGICVKERIGLLCEPGPDCVMYKMVVIALKRARSVLFCAEPLSCELPDIKVTEQTTSKSTLGTTSKSTLKSTSESTKNRNWEITSKSTSESTQNRNLETTSKSTSKSAKNTTLETTTKSTVKSTSKSTSKSIPRSTSKSTQNRNLETTLKGSSNNAQYRNVETTTKSTVKSTSESTSESIPKSTLKSTQKRHVETASKSTLKCTPKSTLENTSKITMKQKNSAPAFVTIRHLEKCIVSMLLVRALIYNL